MYGRVEGTDVWLITCPSKGLTPKVFWTHNEALLGADRSALPGIIRSLLAPAAMGSPSEHQWTIKPTPIRQVGGRLLIISTGGLPSRPSREIPDLAGEISYVVISSIIPPADDNAQAEYILRFRMTEGKKEQILYLQSILPRSMTWIETRLSKGDSVCICCDNGKDASVGVVLAALQLFFDDAGALAATHEEQDRLSKSFTLAVVQRNNYIFFIRKHSVETVYQYKATVDHIE